MPLLRRLRAFGISFFRRFGVHCATHQIRVILISSVVISCLLFPAIAIYSSTQTASFSLSFRVFDVLLTPDDLSNYFALDDVRHLWEGHDFLRVRDDSVARARCGKGRIVRLERVLVHHVSDAQDGQSTLDHRTLLSTLKLEHRLSELLAARRSPCIRSPQGRCLVLSPLSFWDHDEDALLRDSDILETLGPSKNTSAHGLTITADMVLAGRGDGDGSLFGSGDNAYPVLTYFFPESDCLANNGHHFWLNVVEDAAASVDSESIVLTQEPRLLALQYDRGRTPTGRPTVLTVFIYSAYFIFAVYFWRSVRRMDTVHSRIGLAFTGIVEIVVSTITSLSVCALVGFRVTMVPWEIFPIVVIFIGVENMFSIVDAVIKTSIALPVKERIAEGLGYAGTSNSLKLCTYNSVLGAIAFFSSGAIRQFCAFAIVVLVAHWFLVHTFFVTVLSIDIQRLELDELLRQGANLAPSLTNDLSRAPLKQPRTKFGRFMSGLQHALRGRPAKNISLVLLLAITATLYYMTQPHSPHPRALSTPSRTHTKHENGASPAEHVWHTFNPANYDLVHVRIEAPTILLSRQDLGNVNNTLDQQQHLLEYDRSHRSRWAKLWLRMARPTAWVVKIIAIPTFVTTTLLYGLLLYLLKDAELLEAQRNRVESPSPATEDTTPPVDGSVSFTALPRAFATDIDLVGASKDGSIIATVGLQSEFVVWRKDTRTYLTVDTSDILLGSSGSTPSASSALTAIAVSDSGTYVAVGTAAGVIGVWCIGQNRIQAFPSLMVDNLSSVAQIRFAQTSAATTSISTPKRPNGTMLDRVVIAELAAGLYATYDNGVAVKWSLGTHAAPTYIRPSRSTSVAKSMLLRVHADDRLLMGFALDDGMLELCELNRPDGIIPPDCCILAGNPADLVAMADVCKVELEGEPHIVIGAATHAGVVSLWDGKTGERMAILDDAYGPISNLRITPVPMKRCSTCREMPVESFSICFSVGQVVLFYRAYLSLPTRKCSCPVNQPKLISSVVGRKSRSGSVASTVGPSSGTASPVLSRSRPPLSASTAFEASGMYPVSGHGVHSRRASDKRLEPFSEADENDGRSPVGPQDVSVPTTTTSAFLTPGQQPSSLWENLIVTPTAEATFERGSWDVMNNRIVGIRRRPRLPMTNNGSTRGSSKPVPRTQPRIESSKGLTPSTLERWELWTFDPSEIRLQASPLITLDSEAQNSNTPHDEPIRKNLATGFSGQPGTRRPGADVVPRLHFTRVAPLVCGRLFCLAGFGNTVGLVEFGTAVPVARQRTSLERLRTSSGG